MPLRITDAQKNVAHLNKWGVGIEKDLSDLKTQSQKHSTAVAHLSTTIGGSTIPANPNNPTSVSGSSAPITIDGLVYCQVTVNYTSPSPIGTFAGVFLGVKNYNGSTQIVKVAEDNFTGVGGVAQTFKDILNRTGETITVYVIPKNSIEASIADWSVAPSFTLTLNGSVSAPGAPTGLAVTAQPLSNTLAWTGNTEGNMSAYTIYRNTVNTFGSATKIATVPWVANGKPYFVDKDATVGTAYFYWVTATNNATLESSASASTTTTTIAANMDTHVVDGSTRYRPVYDTSAQVASVLYNGSFEIFPSTATTGDGWSTNFEVTGSGGTFARNSSTSYVGSYAQDITIVSGNGTSMASRPFPVKAGAKYTLSAKIKSTVANPGAAFLRIAWYSSDVDFSRAGAATTNDVIANSGPTVANTYQSFSAEFVAPSGTKYARVALYNWSAGLSNTMTFDGVVFGLTTLDLDNAIDDGGTYLRGTVGSLTYRPLTNPITATDAGANATITIGSHTVRVTGRTDVANNSGTVAALPYGTLHYVYEDDAGLAGGARTYVATTTKETALNAAGRIYVGSIKTPTALQPNTIGSQDGGVGAQGGSSIKIFPSIATAGTGGPYLNPRLAYDGDGTTKSTGGVNSVIRTETWSGFSGSIPVAAQSLTLKVDSDVLTGHANSVTLAYSTDGGGTFTNFYTVTGTAVRARQIDSVSITAFSPQQIQVQAQVDNSGTGANVHEIYEIWIEATY